jgi:alpha-amylase
MKKLLSIIMLVSVVLMSSACGLGREYVVKGDHLEAQIMDDNFRVYYEIFVGAFSDSNKDGMGDLRGIINRLDYLNDGEPNSGKSLGVTGIWLMPIMPSPSYHKYDTTNYKEIDKAYGTLEDFEELTTKASERGIDIIIDLVLNHTSNFHPWFREAKKAMETNDLDNPYLEYYTLVTQETMVPGRRYYSFAGDYYYEGNFSPSMPELNMDSELVRQEIIDIVQFWFDKGVKGFRLDATKYIYFEETERNIDFWNWFMEECRKIRPDAYVVGETWSADSLIAPYYEPFSNFDFGMSQSGGAVAVTINMQDEVNSFVSYINSYRNMIMAVNPQAILQPFISNHDMNRAAGFLNVDNYRMHMAATLYLWTYGTPFIYYGEEIGLKGSRGSENTDANRRLKMLWGDRDTVSDPIGASYSIENQTNGTVKSHFNDANSLYNHYKKVIMLRSANPEIARGAYTPLQFSGYFTFGGFLSTYNDSTVGVFHNTGDEPITIDLSNYTNHSFSVLRGFAGKGSARLEGQTLILDGMTSVILK